MSKNLIAALTGFVLLWSFQAVQAENWTNWRGPELNGTAQGSGYPLEWDADKNVAWSVKIPGKAGSTPVVWEDKIITTGSSNEMNAVFCFNRSGEQLWAKELGTSKPGKHKKASGSNPSPVTDGKHVFVYYKSGDFAALDLNGNIVWEQNLQEKYGEDTLWWDLGTSPVLTNEHVVVTCMQSLPSPSYLAAFDKQSGAEIWRVERETGAPEEAAQSYSTPVVTTYQGEEQIIVLGADFVTCHRAADGQELWRVGTLNPEQERFFRSIASPVISGDIVIAPYARGQSLTAIRMGGSGDVTKSHVLWTNTSLSSDVPTPAVQDGKVYVLTDKGTLGCLNAESGEELWTETVPKNRNVFSASPVMIDNKIYLTREDGVTFVVNITDHKLEYTNSLGDDQSVVATPVLVDGEILLRTFDALYCIQGEKKSVSQK